MLINGRMLIRDQQFQPRGGLAHVTTADRRVTAYRALTLVAPTPPACEWALTA